METSHLHLGRFHRRLSWLAMAVCLVAWGYLRFGLGWPAAVDCLVLVALLAEAALVLSHHPAR
jgi:hypothetical protein